METLIAQIPVWDDSVAFPQEVFLLLTEDGRQACYHVKEWDITGLAVFSNESSAIRFGEWLPDAQGLVAFSVSTPDALETAHRMGSSIDCLMLLDEVNHPLVLPVR